MARIVTSSMISDIRGSIGGLTFSRNPAGLFVRSRIKPLNPPTYYSGNPRAMMAAASGSWRNLSFPDRELWIAAAPPGTTGHNLFVSYYINAALVGLSPVSAPPIPQALTGNSFASVTIDQGTGVFTLDFNLNFASNNYIFIQASQPMSQGQVFNKKFMRHIGTQGMAGTNTFDIGTYYGSRFNFAPRTGFKFFVQVQEYNYVGNNIGPPYQAYGICT